MTITADQMARRDAAIAQARNDIKAAMAEQDAAIMRAENECTERLRTIVSELDAVLITVPEDTP